MPPLLAARAPAQGALRWGTGERERPTPASRSHQLQWGAGSPSKLLPSSVQQGPEPRRSEKNAAGLLLAVFSRAAWIGGGAGGGSLTNLLHTRLCPFLAGITPGWKLPAKL